MGSGWAWGQPRPRRQLLHPWQVHNVSFAFELMLDGGLKKPKARPEGKAPTGALGQGWAWLGGTAGSPRWWEAGPASPNGAATWWPTGRLCQPRVAPETPRFLG